MAVLAILLFHYLWATGILRTSEWLIVFDHLIAPFWFGVDVFFALSGYLIGLSLIRTRGDRGYYSGFYVKRLARIAPLYYLWLIPFLVARHLGAASWGEGYASLFGLEPISGIAYATFLQNFEQAALGGWGGGWLGVTWSLSIEMQFYLIVPVVLALAPPRRLLAVCAAIMVLSLVAYLAIAHFAGHFAAHVLTISRLDAPFAGVAAAAVVSMAGLRGAVQRHPIAILAVTIACGLALYAAFVLVSFGTLDMHTVTITLVRHLLEWPFLIGLLLLAYVGRLERLAGPAFGWLRWLGVRCFSIYLIHFGILGLLAQWLAGTSAHTLSGSAFFVLVPAIALTIGVAWLSWWSIEWPAIKASHRFGKRSSLQGSAPSLP